MLHLGKNTLLACKHSLYQTACVLREEVQEHALFVFEVDLLMLVTNLMGAPL